MSGMETVLTDTVKGSMRMSSKSAVVENDINNTIAAAKMDLKAAGVKKIDETDPLIIRAVTLYAKADMNYQNRGEQYRQSYELQRQSLCLDGDYNTEEG